MSSWDNSTQDAKCGVHKESNLHNHDEDSNGTDGDTKT